MPSQKLVLGMRNSLPVGTTEEEFEKAYQSMYKPFLTLLYNHPGVYMWLYYSGNLLEWLENRHPEFLMLLNDLSKRKQIELLGGVQYEAFLPLVPSQDRLGQIEYLTTFIRKRFGRRPRGGLLPGDVWEPSLASTLKSAGFEYIFLPDSYFAEAGCRGKELYMPAFTEDLGKSIIVYPVSAGLSGRIGNIDTVTFVDELRLIYRNTGSEVICLNLEPQKSLEWYEQFFQEIENRSSEVATFRPVRCTRQFKALNKHYFSSITFQSLMHWLEEGAATDEYEYPDSSVLPSGSYRYFLTRYPEGNALYSKMMYTSLLVNQIKGDRSRKKTAREELWKAQSNEAYWHGADGGIYRRIYRNAAYHSLLEAEKVTKERGIFKPSVFITDFDMDGLQEYLYRGTNINAYLHQKGGTLFELDYFPASWNFGATMSRHNEVYRSGSSTPDAYPRRSFMDRIVKEEQGEDFIDRRPGDDECDLMGLLYSEESIDRERRQVCLGAECRIRQGDSEIPITLKKDFSFRKNTLHVTYKVTNTGDEPFKRFFASEMNFAFSDPENLAISTGENPGDPDDTAVIFMDKGIKSRMSLNSDKTFTWKAVPMVLEYLTLAGMAEEYQQHAVLLQWPLELGPSETWETVVQLKVDKL